MKPAAQKPAAQKPAAQLQESKEFIENLIQGIKGVQLAVDPSL